jgi:hypothetical protein
MRSFSARVLSVAVLSTSMLAGAAAGTAPAARAASVIHAASPEAPRGGPPQGAEERALAAAKSAGHAVAVPQDTTPTDSVAANPDGTLTLTRSTAPVRKLSGGAWKSLDAALHRGAGGKITTAVTTAGVELTGGGSGPLATLTAAGRTLAVSFPVPLPAPALSGSTAAYADVLPGVDLLVTADAQGSVSDVLVVRSASAAADPRLKSLALAISAPGLTLAVGSAGNITLSGPGGHVVFATPTPFMWDSAAAPAGTSSATKPDGSRVDARTGRPLASSAVGPGVGARNVPVGVAARSGAIVLTPNRGMLTSPGTVFPVYIDPTFNAPSAGTSGPSGWDTVNNYYTTASNWKTSTLQVGYQGWESPFFVARSYLNVPVPSKIYGSHVISAQFNMHEIWSPSCTAKPVKLVLAGGISSSTTWNSQPGTNTTNGTVQDTQTVAHGYSSSCPEAGVGFNVANALQSAASNSWTQVTFGVAAGSESDAYGWKQFNTTGSLSVTYDHTPATPTKLTTSPATSCSGATIVGDGDVKLYVPVSDPDGGTLGVALQMWKTGTSTAFKGTPTNPQSFYGANNTTLTFVAHKADLEAAAGGAVTEFSWKAQVTDFYATSAWSATCNFKFDASRPGPPDVDVSSESFTIGQATSVPVTPPQSGTLPVSYLYQVNGGPPATVAAAADGTASIPVTPTRFANLLTVAGLSPAGNLGAQAVSDPFYAAPGATAADADLTGDGTADLVTAGGGGMAPGLWLASGRGDGRVVTQAVDFGANGNGTTGDYSPADFTTAQVITGHFDGTQFQDALVYYPGGVPSDPTETAGQANILFGTGDGSANNGTGDASGGVVTEQTINGDVFNDGFGAPLQLANAGDTQGHVDQTTGLPSALPWPDLIGISQGGTLVYMPNSDGFGNYQATIDLGNNSPDGSLDWASWQIATAQVPSGTAMYLWNPGTGALYLWTGLHYDDVNGVITYTSYQIADGSATIWNAGAALTLHAADINGDGTADLWAVNASGVVTAYLAAFGTGTGTATLTAQPAQTLLASTHTWPLADSQATAGGDPLPATAADTTGSTALPLTFSGNVQWNTGDLFDPDVTLGLTADGDPGGGTGYLATTGVAVNPNSGGFTVSAWANPAALGGTVLSQDMSNTASFRLSSTTAGAWQFCLAQSNVASPAWDCATGGSAQLGEWASLTATYDPATKVVSLYQGDVKVAYSTHTALSGITNAAFEVGAYPSGTSRTGYFTGQVSQVQTWSRVIAPTQVSSPGGYFHPMTPVRIFSTRVSPNTPIAANATYRLQITGVAGIPTTNVTAVAVTLAVVTPANGGNLRVYPDQTTQPYTSWVNFQAGVSAADMVIVAVGPDGKIAIGNSSGGAIDLLADVSGYFTSDPTVANPATYAPMPLTRILDTRNGTGAAKAKVAADGTLAVQVGGANGIPSVTQGLKAVAIQVTVINQANNGFLTGYPDGITRPQASTTQFYTGNNVTVLEILPVGSNGKIDIYNGSSGTTDLIGDVTGYFMAGTSGQKFHAIGGNRLIAPVAVASGATQAISTGTSVVALQPTLVLNIGVIAPASGGWLSTYADGTTRPGGTDVNFWAGSETIANLTLSPASAAGVTDASNGGGSLQLYADCSGYFSAG